MIQRSKIGLKFFSPTFSTPCLSSWPVNRSDAWHITVALPAQQRCAQTSSANVLKPQKAISFCWFFFYLLLLFSITLCSLSFFPSPSIDLFNRQSRRHERTQHSLTRSNPMRVKSMTRIAHLLDYIAETNFHIHTPAIQSFYVSGFPQKLTLKLQTIAFRADARLVRFGDRPSGA